MTTPILTDDQRATIQELQKELEDLNLQADVAWAKYMHTKDEDCWDEVQALQGEIEMKGLIAYIPKVGERKIDKIRKLVGKVKGIDAGEECDGCELGPDEARIQALRGVNAWREEYDLPPLDRLPKGNPGDAHDCTLARAFYASGKALGLSDIDIHVSEGDKISLRGYDKDGDFQMYEPLLGDWGTKLIGGFDENAWLDLLDDVPLQTYAEGQWEDSQWERLQDISDEMAFREMTYHVGYQESRINLGKDALPIVEQVDAMREGVGVDD